MSVNDSQSTIEVQGNSNNSDEAIDITYENLVELAGEKFHERIIKEAHNFTEQVTLVNNSVSLAALPEPESRQQTAMLRQQYLQISVQGFQSKVKEEVQGFTEHVSSIGREESAFNTKAKLLLQCHTMSAYITNTLMEKLQKKKQESRISRRIDKAKTKPGTIKR